MHVYGFTTLGQDRSEYRKATRHVVKKRGMIDRSRARNIDGAAARRVMCLVEAGIISMLGLQKKIPKMTKH